MEAKQGGRGTHVVRWRIRRGLNSRSGRTMDGTALAHTHLGARALVIVHHDSFVELAKVAAQHEMLLQAQGVGAPTVS